MARQRVEGKQDHVEQQNQAANADTKVSVEEKSIDGIVPQESQKYNREIQKVAVHILQNEREGRLPAIFSFGRFSHRARRGIEEKCAVIRFAVVIAGGAKSQWARENQ